MIDVSTEGVLDKARAMRRIDDDTAHALIESHRMMTGIIQLLRLSVDGAFDPRLAAEGVKRRIAVLAGLPDFKTLEADLATRRHEVRRLFDRLLTERPALAG